MIYWGQDLSHFVDSINRFIYLNAGTNFITMTPITHGNR